MNEVREEDVALLRTALHRTEGRDTEGLKRMFLETLTNGTGGHRGGAGLGLIEMARRSGHPLRHHISPSTGSTHRFHLVVSCGTLAGDRGPQWLMELDLTLRSVGLLAAVGGRTWSAGEEEKVLRMIEDEPGIPGPELARACHAGIAALLDLRREGGGGLLLCRNDGRGWCMDVLVNTGEEVGIEALAHVQMLNAASRLERRTAYHHALLGKPVAQAAWRTALHELALRVRAIDVTLRILPEDGPVLLLEGRI